jgi:hypothetical protein
VRAALAEIPQSGECGYALRPTVMDSGAAVE